MAHPDHGDQHDAEHGDQHDAEHGDQYDAVIAGGGLAGLSLAAHLAAYPDSHRGDGWRGRVLLVDDPTAPHAASWGYWSVRPGLLGAAAGHRAWRSVRVHAAGRSLTVPLDPYRYRVVRRADLERAVTHLLSATADPAAGGPRFEVRRGRVDAVRDGPHAASVVVDGAVARTRWVFDSVTAPAVRAAADARLAFTGWTVRCPRAVFDPDTPVLFDFGLPQAGGSRFVYVLPEDGHTALVELTAFVPRHAEPPSDVERSAALAGYLDRRVGPYEVLRTESAVVPLRSRPARRGAGRVLRIGAAGGLVKASTGYAYERIQRDSAAIAASLARHGHPFDLPAAHRPLPGRRRAPHRHGLPDRHRLLDAVLLAMLDREPARLEWAFGRLFAANPAGRVLRFLDEDTTPAQEARLIASLCDSAAAPLPYLRALATVATGRRWSAATWSKPARNAGRAAIG